MIRSFKKDDEQKLYDIFRLNIPVNFAPEELQDFRKFLSANKSPYFVIMDNDQLAGGFGYVINSNRTEAAIKWIFLHPDYISKGHGRQAVDFSISQLAVLGIERVWVETSQRADKFFASFGFLQTDYKPDYWGEGLHLVKMKLVL